MDSCVVTSVQWISSIQNSHAGKACELNMGKVWAGKYWYYSSTCLTFVWGWGCPCPRRSKCDTNMKVVFMLKELQYVLPTYSVVFSYINQPPLLWGAPTGGSTSQKRSELCLVIVFIRPLCFSQTSLIHVFSSLSWTSFPVQVVLPRGMVCSFWVFSVRQSALHMANTWDRKSTVRLYRLPSRGCLSFSHFSR